MKARRLSLGWELGELERAVDAARILCGLSGEGQFATRQEAERAPLGAAAVLALVAERLRLVRRVVHGWAPTELLVAAHNEIHETDAPLENDDVLLPLERKRVRSRADGAKRGH
jgi:hypothetical protein